MRDPLTTNHLKLIFDFFIFSFCFTLYLLFSPYALPSTCRSPLSVQMQESFFSYPASYLQLDYAVPTVQPPCNTSITFNDYDLVFKEIQDSVRRSSKNKEAKRLRYLSGPRSTFAGNFSNKERKGFLNFNGDEEVPCGFMKEFNVSNSDKLAMEDCKGVMVASVVIGNYDKIRQPRGVSSKTLQITCFFLFVDDRTVKGLHDHKITLNRTGENKIGIWRIVRILELPYTNPALNGEIPKQLLHKIFPNSIYSIWVDAKLQLTVDPLLLLDSLLISADADMAISKHPFNIHAIEEAIATARYFKWADIQSLKKQMET